MSISGHGILGQAVAWHGQAWPGRAAAAAAAISQLPERANQEKTAFEESAHTVGWPHSVWFGLFRSDQCTFFLKVAVKQLSSKREMSRKEMIRLGREARALFLLQGYLCL